MVGIAIVPLFIAAQLILPAPPRRQAFATDTELKPIDTHVSHGDARRSVPTAAPTEAGATPAEAIVRDNPTEAAAKGEAPVEMAADRTSSEPTAGAVTQPVRALEPEIAADPLADRTALEVSLHGGRFVFRTDQVPVLGDPRAPATVVSLIDYACDHCRVYRRLLEGMVHRFRDRVSFIILPVPLNNRCNPYVRTGAPREIANCEFAMLALAVWKAAPERFAEFDRWLSSEESPAAQHATLSWKIAQQRAEDLVGARYLAKALADPWVKNQFRTNVELYAANLEHTGNGSMPQQFFGSALNIGSIEAAAAFLALVEQHLGVTPNN